MVAGLEAHDNNVWKVFQVFPVSMRYVFFFSFITIRPDAFGENERSRLADYRNYTCFYGNLVVLQFRCVVVYMAADCNDHVGVK